MKISELWLREWVNPAGDVKHLAELLTMAGLEVDTVTPVAGEFNDVIVAQVKSTQPHPKADRLTLCEVDAGNGKVLKVVCGAANVRPGLKVALAQIGANLPGGFVIKEATLRGELSQGMLCSETELGLADEADGIMELAEDAPVGVNFRAYLSLDDHVLDIDLTPNRADCFSVLGVAREISALTKLPLKPISTSVIQPSIDETLVIRLQESEACPQYYGRVIRGINSQAQTPLWMSERLRRAGIRVIHPVVDVTNYVMLELGQPMHAFDLQKIKGEIVVRFARSDESLELLDGQKIQLNEKVLVIADSTRPLALAGVMGGDESAVTESTQAIFLESAFFNPITIAGVARSFGLCSDSSQRFERGVDPALQAIALERATELLLEIVGGEAGPISFSNEPNALPQKHTLLFNPTKVEQLTGMAIAEEEMAGMLQGLGMSVEQNGLSWKVGVPSHRFDISLEVDLVEEIIRLYGYHNIQGQQMKTSVQAGTINPSEALAMKLTQFFKVRGYHETISYSFVDPELQQLLYPDVKTMELLNPISSELSQMRVGMWPGLLASMIYNIHRQQVSIKFFENGVVFDLRSGTLQEYPSIAGLLTGERGAMNWSEQKAKFDFFDLKGDLEALFASLHLNNTRFVAASHPALHPGKSALILIDEQQAGWCGALHPRISDALDLQEEVIVFELSINSLLNQTSPQYQQISKFPQIRRDLSFLVDEKVLAAQIEAQVRAVVKPELLKSFDIFDVYQGETIPEGKKSIAIALTLQDDNRTLIDSEINAIINAIIKKLDNELSILLRD